MTLNLQIVPFNAPLPAGAKLVLLPAREQDLVEPQTCPRCDGTGKLPKFGDDCHACRGTGKGRFVQALRWDDPTEEELRALWPTLEVRKQRVQFTVRIEEQGGGSTNTGSADIVCGLNGEKLPAVYGRALCNKAHATFYVHAAMVVHYSQHRGDGQGSVDLITLSGPEWGEHWKPRVTTLWRFADGEDDIEIVDSESAKGLVFPEEAVEAARRKSRDYHCRSAFYCAEKGASGPSGALTGAGAAFGGQPSPFKGPGIGY